MRKESRLALTLASLLLITQHAWADGSDTAPRAADNSGFTVLSNATNVTHWGIGGGAGIGESLYKGYGSKTTPIPLFFFDDKWVHAFGTTLDLKVGTWQGFHVMLRGTYSVADGYKSSDASILHGMEKRHSGFWYGPAFSWNTTMGTLSGDILTAGNKGQEAHLEFAKRFKFGQFSVQPHLSGEWLSHKNVDYYAGVRDNEVRAYRPAYTGTASFNETLGVQVAYQLTRRQSLSVDVGGTHLGTGIVNSPIVGKRYLAGFRVGYLYQFR